MTRGLRRIRAIPAGIAVLAMLSCSEDRREIEVSRVLRPISEGIRWNVGAADRFVMRTTPARPQVQEPMFAWDLPDGWTTLPAREFRQANFGITAHLDVECYLSVVGGGARDNVNRWRGQMGLAGLTATEMEALPTRAFFGTDAYYLEMAGSFSGMSGAPRPGSMLVGLVLAAPQQTLTLKLIGPEAAVQDELERFAALAASFRLAPSLGPAVPLLASGSLDWKAPAGWRPSPPRPMTEVAFDLGEGTACWISVLGGGGGGADANIQRWRAEMGGAQVAAQQLIPMFGTQGTMIEISGRFGGNSAVAPIDDATMLAVSCGLGDRTIFVKMIGPRAEVQAHHQEFLEFCASLGE